MQSLARLTALSIALSVLCGCDSAPRLESFTEYIKQEADAECSGKCRFVSVVKTDGQAQNAFGVSAYVMNANVTVQVLQELSYASPGVFSGFIVIAGPGLLRAKAKPGDTLRLPIRLGFQKFESGWKINRIQRKMF
jgi:hypothetical protein